MSRRTRSSHSSCVRRRHALRPHLEDLEGRIAPATVLGLDGIDDYATIADNNSLDLGVGATDDFMIATSFCVSHSTQQGVETLINKANAYSLFVTFSSPTGDIISFKLSGPGNTLTVSKPTFLLTDGWHNLAAVFDNEYTSTKDLVELYLDGSQFLSTTNFTEFSVGLNNTTTNLDIGGDAGTNPFKGKMDEVSLWNVDPYSVPMGPGPVALWHFDEAPGSTIFADASGHGNTLTGLNGAQTVNDGTEVPSLVVTTSTDLVDANDGVTSLREALAYAATLGANPTVTFAAGLPSPITLASGLVLGANVTIAGPGAASLTVSGGGPSSDFSVFTVNSNVTATITGLTIANGNTSGKGGGVYNTGTVTLTDVTLTGNSAAFFGGGVCNYYGTVTLTNVTLSGNSAYSGGGVCNTGTVTLTDVTLAGNSAAWVGGGVYNYGTATLTNVALAGNSASRGGGGVYNGGTATLTNVTLSGNSTTNDGGGVDNDGTVTLTNVTLSGNSAYSGGGIYNDFQGTVTLTNVTLAGNSATLGGGIHNESGTVTLTDVTLAGNLAYLGLKQARCDRG